MKYTPTEFLSRKNFSKQAVWVFQLATLSPDWYNRFPFNPESFTPWLSAEGLAAG
jgi:hypothetical protein